ncbi:MAG TPA: hypothetical protein DIT64_20950 [Verrucomicrobiales bacterium]|nr:hypothetical protein [Verrucomicrobiales bacterium]
MGFQPRKNAPSRGDLQKNHTAIALTLLPSARRTCHFKRDCGAPTSSARLPFFKKQRRLTAECSRGIRSMRPGFAAAFGTRHFSTAPLKPGNLAHHRDGLI